MTSAPSAVSLKCRDASFQTSSGTASVRSLSLEPRAPPCPGAEGLSGCRYGTPTQRRRCLRRGSARR
jgi:hypothetical protein